MALLTRESPLCHCFWFALNVNLIFFHARMQLKFLSSACLPVSVYGSVCTLCTFACTVHPWVCLCRNVREQLTMEEFINFGKELFNDHADVSGSKVLSSPKSGGVGRSRCATAEVCDDGEGAYRLYRCRCNTLGCLRSYLTYQTSCRRPVSSWLCTQPSRLIESALTGDCGKQTREGG